MQLKTKDAGFTLIELLMSIVILGIISFPLASIVISYFHNTNATVARLAESHDAQITASYWAQDVASIGTHDWTQNLYPFPLTQSVQCVENPTGTCTSSPGVAFNAGLYTCGSGTPRNALVVFAWDDFSGGSTTPTPPPQIRVAYVLETATVLGLPQTQLHRVVCTAASSTPTSDVVLAHYVNSASLPVVNCSTASGVATSCNGTATAVPQYVTLTLNLKAPNNTDTSAHSVVLTGQRRQT